ncbi:hypothetical protein GCN74_11405 [Janthinobacterium sp. FT14W]|uniref:hypothetical protein n=1 Tax=Janthinobacterium sp. FT14W TaxID=2654253 RepID=UPI0012659586|nr:hypothetical protein [Janthinobacterium sp. FT14W]KAB8059707.1 hypothetical protein GCN74_11405 [Janthinobacterium sp. FT14W]
MAPDWTNAGLIGTQTGHNATPVCPVFGQFDSLWLSLILGIFALKNHRDWFFIHVKEGFSIFAMVADQVLKPWAA